jgi:hypothetical protein
MSALYILLALVSFTSLSTQLRSEIDEPDEINHEAEEQVSWLCLLLNSLLISFLHSPDAVDPPPSSWDHQTSDRAQATKDQNKRGCGQVCVTHCSSSCQARYNEHDSESPWMIEFLMTVALKLPMPRRLTSQQLVVFRRREGGHCRLRSGC